MSRRVASGVNGPLGVHRYDEYTRQKKNMQKYTFPRIFFAETWWDSELTFYCLVPKRASKNIEGNFTLKKFFM